MKFLLKNENTRKPFKARTFLDFTLLQLLQHNVHLGSAIKFSLLSSHWFIYGVRQRFAIINLSQTIIHYRYFLEVIRHVARVRRHILFVNERRYTSLIVGNLASSVGEAYVMGRWVGGSLTNFKRIWLMYYRLLKYKKEAYLTRFKINLKNSLNGLMILKSLPSAICFNSVRHNYWGTGESYALHIPAGGITDTDAAPHSVMHPLPGNDDAFGAVFFLNQLVAKTVLISKIVAMLKAYEEFCAKLEKFARKQARRKARKDHKKRKFNYQKR